MSAAPTGPDPAAQAAGQRTILVVDDIPMFRALLADMLASAGRVVEAEDGAQALELARKERPDLVVSDLEMPGLDGAALCRAVRADEDLARTHFLMLLPGGDARDHVRAIRAGADDALAKPLQRTELLGSVRRFLATPTVRGLPRVAVDTPVTVYLSRSQERARATNVSRGGLFLRTELPLPRRSEWRIRFQLPEQETPLSPTAMVVWRAEADAPTGPGPGLGMRFMELDGAAARRLDEYVYERTPVSHAGPPPRP